MTLFQARLLGELSHVSDPEVKLVVRQTEFNVRGSRDRNGQLL